MRSKATFLVRCSSFVVLTVFLLGSIALAAEPTYAVLNPQGIKPDVKQFALTPRLTDFNGKTVYVISQHVGDADIFLKKVTKLLPQYLPGVKAVYKDKPSAYMTNDPELWDETAKNAQAYIYGAAA
jgi:hypothetical protein